MPKRLNILTACTALGLSLLNPIVQAEAGHWGYFGELGPSHWAELDPAYKTCGKGKSQSPINLGLADHVRMPPPQFRYRSSTLEAINNGHTVQFNVEPGSQLRFNDKLYELKQFHFHTPSEHEVNSRQLALEIHLVHQSSDGELAVVGVMARPARRGHHALKRLWDHLPEKKGSTNQAGGLRMNPITLLPFKRDFMTYEGSLTTPPCTEGVRWIVMREPLAVSDNQVETFTRLIGGNARPVQPLNDRKVVTNR